MDNKTGGMEKNMLAGSDNWKNSTLNDPHVSERELIRSIKGHNLKEPSPFTERAENQRIPEAVSILENAERNVEDDEEWTNSLESCLNLSLKANFQGFTEGEASAVPQDTLEDQLEQYFSRTFENYDGYFKKDDTEAHKAWLSQAKDHANHMAANHDATEKKFSISPEGTVICCGGKNVLVTNSNTSTDCGVCGYAVTNTAPSPISSTSEQTKIDHQYSNFSGFNTPDHPIGDSISVNLNHISEVNELSGTYHTSNASSASVYNSNSHTRSGNQISSNFLGDMIQNKENSSAADVSSFTRRETSYDPFAYFNKDMLTTVDSYYKTMGNKEMDYIFNSMDTLSTVDNLLNKDTTDFGLPTKEFNVDLISDYNAEVNTDLLNNDALFSEIYRDKDVDNSESWEVLMRNLSFSKQRKQYPTLNESKGSAVHTNSNATIQSSTPSLTMAQATVANGMGGTASAAVVGMKEATDLGLNLKNKDNLPSILPSDPNLGFKKTSLCKYWQRGICANDDCNFAHGKKELRSTIGVWRTTICHHWKTGVCRVGKDCRHAHGEEELQPKNIPANVLKNKLLNSARKYEYMRKKKNTY